MSKYIKIRFSKLSYYNRTLLIRFIDDLNARGYKYGYYKFSYLMRTCLSSCKDLNLPIIEARSCYNVLDVIRSEFHANKEIYEFCSKYCRKIWI